jgi:4-hydroxyphenylpyruvate dioxygenase-like putative hemolysin
MKRKNNKLPFLDNGVGQIAFVVEDLEKTVKKFYEVFGIGPWDFYTYEKPLVKKMTYYGQEGDYSMRIALSYFGPTRIELIETKHGNSVYQDFIDKHGYGIHHLGFRIDDMQSALELANKAGYSMIQDGKGFGLDGDGHYAYLDTEKDFGFLIELIETPKRRNPPEKIYPNADMKFEKNS